MIGAPNDVDQEIELAEPNFIPLTPEEADGLGRLLEMAGPGSRGRRQLPGQCGSRVSQCVAGAGAHGASNGEVEDEQGQRDASGECDEDVGGRVDDG